MTTAIPDGGADPDDGIAHEGVRHPDANTRGERV
jgi:hypothetical protein